MHPTYGRARRGISVVGKLAGPTSNRGRVAPDGTSPAIEARRHLIAFSHQLLGDPDGWYTASNARFGGRRPIDLIDTKDEVHVYNLLRAADQGLF